MKAIHSQILKKSKDGELGFRGSFFIFVGVLRYYKGLHILLAAAKFTSLEILIVGSGPMEALLKEQAKREQLSNVFFLGALSDREKMALLRLSVGFVFPSHLRSEAFGLSLVEAAMAGKPLITCEIGTGTSFVNIDRETGLVVEPNDPVALADAMNEIASAEDMAASMGSAARARFLKLFTAEAMGSSYMKLYEGLLAGRGMRSKP